MAEVKLREILGVCHILVGDPTEAAGAGMENVGMTRGDVTVELQPMVAYARGDQAGAVPLAGSMYSSGLRPVVTAPLYPPTMAMLNRLLPGSKVATSGDKTALLFGSPGRIPEEDIPTMVLVPADEAADGVDAQHAIWLPAMAIMQAGQLTFNLPEGDDAGTPMEFQFASAYREADQAATAIDRDARIGWMGPPAAIGLEWSLPNLTQL